MATTGVSFDGVQVGSNNPMPVTTSVPAAATSIAKAEDSAHATTHVGALMLGVRRDTAAVGSDTDGDYSTVNLDASGRLWSHVGAIDAGTTYIGQTAGPIQYVTVSMTTPTDALDAGDVVAATQVVAACTRANDVPAILDSVVVIDPDDQGANLNLVFFDANTELGTEDAAPDIDDTEVLTYQGEVVILSTDWVDVGGADVVCKKNVGLVVKPATGTDDIYMAIYTPATSTPTYAGGVITVRLGFRST